VDAVPWAMRDARPSSATSEKHPRPASALPEPPPVPGRPIDAPPHVFGPRPVSGKRGSAVSGEAGSVHESYYQGASESGESESSTADAPERCVLLARVNPYDLVSRWCNVV